jgi:hypothetical protein
MVSERRCQWAAEDLAALEAGSASGNSKFPQVIQVDTSLFFSYTCAVVLWALTPGGMKGKSSRPGTRAKERDREERPKWGASPAKPCEPLRSFADAVHSSG